MSDFPKEKCSRAIFKELRQRKFFGNLSGDTGQRQLKFRVLRLQTLGNREVKLGFVSV